MKNSFRIIFVLIAISAMLYFVFSEKKSKSVLEFSDLYEETYKFEVPDTLGPMIIIRDLLAVGDSVIVFSELNTSVFYHLDRKQGLFKQMTNVGLGPGEFQMPKGVIHDGEYLTLTGAAKPVISYFDFQGNFVKDIKSGSQFGLGEIVKYKDSYLKRNSLRSPNYFKFVHDTASFYPIPEKLRQTKGIFSSAPGAFIQKDILYFMNPYESKIHCYDLENRKILEPILIPDLHTPGYNLGQNQHPSLRNIDSAGAYKVANFKKVLIDGELYFAVVAYYNMKDEYKSYVKILSFDGKPYIDIKEKIGEILHSDDNRFIFYKSDFDEGISDLIEYRLKR